MTTPALAAWARETGASHGSALAFARHFVGRYAGRSAGRAAGRAVGSGAEGEGDPRVSKKLLSLAAAAFSESVPEATPSAAADGTVRFVVRLCDGELVESVAIPHPTRSTVCLSTQAGCARGCVFCETGRLGLARQLLPEEITGQFAAVARYLALHGERQPTNVVFMGMGEPLDNLDAVLEASAVLSDDSGFAVARRRITISTVGVVPKLRELYARSKLRVAVSLHSANDAERRALLPVARTWDLAALRSAIADSPDTVLLQWTMIEGVNDTDRHLGELLAFCEDLDVRVNLIPLNPGPDDTLRASPMERVRAFQKQLNDAGLRTLVRMPHGREIGGACGQLAGARRGAGPEAPLTRLRARARRSTL